MNHDVYVKPSDKSGVGEFDERVFDGFQYDISVSEDMSSLVVSESIVPIVARAVQTKSVAFPGAIVVPNQKDIENSRELLHGEWFGYVESPNVVLVYAQKPEPEKLKQDYQKQFLNAIARRENEIQKLKHFQNLAENIK